mmetsp:Transcript_86390/g.172863  ORF Transcript_86390/g.172863 Transcript_86390/m.172863 type:complete len:250 (-) Transcript_86390:337-1086(-)
MSAITTEPSQGTDPIDAESGTPTDCPPSEVAEAASTSLEGLPPPSSSSTSMVKRKRGRTALPRPPKRRSIYVGVVQPKTVVDIARSDEWITRIKIGKETRQMGPFMSEEDAARAYDEVAGPLGRPVNFPAANSEQKKAGKESASKYVGVCWHKPSRHWTASISIKNKNMHLGYFKEEIAAARKYDEQAVSLGRKVNFPDPLDTAPPSDEIVKGALVAATLLAGQQKGHVDLIAKHVTGLVELEVGHTLV